MAQFFVTHLFLPVVSTLPSATTMQIEIGIASRIRYWDRNRPQRD